MQRVNRKVAPCSKNVVKSENREFIALFDASGWNQAECGRRLHKDRASISRYLSGQIPPERSVIELFKLILASVNPAALEAAGKRGANQVEQFIADSLYEKLNELKSHDPRAYKELERQVDFLHERMAKAPADKTMLKKGAEGVKRSPSVIYPKHSRRQSRRHVSSGKTAEDQIAEAFEEEAGLPPKSPPDAQ